MIRDKLIAAICVVCYVLKEMGALMSIALALATIFVWAAVADLHHHIH